MGCLGGDLQCLLNNVYPDDILYSMFRNTDNYKGFIVYRVASTIYTNVSVMGHFK